MWTSEIRNQLMASNGSIQDFKMIPENIRKLYRTVWEIPQKHFINLAVSRAPFICQSQSLNIYMSDLSYDKISNMHMYGWKQGLKTGLYYLRGRSAVDAIKFTVDYEKILADKPLDYTNKSDSKNDADADGLRKRNGNDVGGENTNLEQPKKRLRTIPLSDYKEDICENCGS